MKILVTGGAGLIGFNIAKHYKENGHSVYIMDNLERSSLLGHEVSQERKLFNITETYKLNIPFFRADVSQAEDWRAISDGAFIPDVIFHMAAQCGVPTFDRDWETGCLA